MSNKSKDLSYLKANKVKHFSLFNYIISYPQNSIQWEHLEYSYSSCIYTRYGVILVTKY
jgi:hypothetical protein